MNIFSRLKRLWELSGTHGEIVTIPSEEFFMNNFPDAATTKKIEDTGSVDAFNGATADAIHEKREATIVHDDPLDVFPSEDDTESEPKSGE